MSRSARRVSGHIRTESFGWQRTRRSPATPIVLVPERVAPSTPEEPDADWRELQLPSVERERIEAAEKQAIRTGYADGQRAAEADAATRLEATLGRLSQAIQDVGNARPVLLERAEKDLVRLALAIAERVIRREVDVNPELLTAMARVAIERLSEQAAAAVHLNPHDARSLLSRGPAPAGIEIVADATLERGACRVRSLEGAIDMGIASQIQELARELLGDSDDEISLGA